MADYVLSAKGTYDGTNMDKGVEESRKKVEGLTQSSKSVASAVTGAIGSALSSVAGVVTGSIGTVTAGIAGLAATGGISRALNMEKAKTMFKGLKLDWNDYKDTINEAVKGTAFSMDSAALVASSLAASGVAAGEDMSRSLNAVVGTAATFGADLSDIGDIFQKVAAGGKLTGEQLAQMSDRGINGLSVLSEYLGKSQAEIRDMVKNGEIDFETFSSAMNASFGDAAKGANDTFVGAMSNVKAALSRVGAKFADPALDGLRQVFAALIPVIDAASVALDPLVTAFSDFISGVIPRIVEGIGSLQGAIEGLGEGGFLNLSNKAKGAAAAIGILSIGSLGGLAAQIPIIGGLFGGLAGILGGLSNPMTLIEGVIVKFSGAFAGIGAAAAEAGGGIGGMASAIGGAIGPFGAVLGTVGLLAAAFIYLMSTSEQFRDHISELVGTVAAGVKPSIDAMKDAFAEFGDSLAPVGETMESALLPFMTALADLIGSLVVSLAPLIAAIVGGLLPVLSSLASVFGTIFSVVLDVAATLMEQLTPVMTMLIDAVTGVMEAVMPLIAQAAETIAPIISDIVVMIGDLATSIIELVMPVITQIAAFVQEQLPPLAELFSTFCSYILEAIEFSWPTIQGIIETVMNAVMAIIETVWPIIETIVTTVMDVISGVIAAVMAAINGDWSGAWTAIQGVAQSVWNGISSIVSSAVGIISGIVSSLVSAVGGFFSSMWSSVTSAVSSMWSSVTSAFSSGVESAKSFVSGLPGEIAGFFGNAGSLLVDAGHSIIDGLLSGIRSSFENVKSFVGGIGTWIADHKGPKSYDLRLLVPNGRWIMSSLETGFEIGKSSLLGTIEGITEAIGDAVSSSDIGLLAGEGSLEVSYSQNPRIDVVSGTEAEVSALRSELAELRAALGGIIADNAPVVVESERDAARRYRKAVYA